MTTPATTESTALRLTGRDVLLVLHRVSTQRLDELAPGLARTTLFCDFRGRLLHRAAVAHARDGAVWLLRDDAPGAELAAFVDRQVFREDVQIEDRSAAHAVRLVRSAPRDVHADGARAFDGDDVPVLVPEDDATALALGGAHAAEGIDEAARIALGRARHGAEIAAAFTPYEVNLAAFVHLGKGCYTGQETLQRLVTYDSVRRGLAHVGGDGAPPAPQPLVVAGEPAGVLTSATAAADGWRGLAVVSLAALAGGTSWALADGGALAMPELLPTRRPLGR